MSSSQSLSFLGSVLTLLVFPLLTTAHTCSEGFLVEVRKINITQNCNRKPLQSEFAWSFDHTTRQLDIALGARLDAETGWLAWGLNPQGPHMVGTRALIGVKRSTGELVKGKYDITAATKRGCQMSPSDDIGLDVRNFTFDNLKGLGYYMIRATVILPEEYNTSSTNIVWQVGDVATDKRPLKHPTYLENLDSAETVDLNSHHESHKAHSRRRLRMAHGILNIVGWGFLVPVGIICARYLRKFPIKWPSRWFVLHVGCQIAGYILGTIGWAIGLYLGDASKYYRFLTHRILAIVIFTFTTIQMMALSLKPKNDDEYRTYWNMYHHSLGYALLALIVVNIFQGIKIMEPNPSWKWGYIGVLGVLGAVVLAFEVYTWIKFLNARLRCCSRDNNSSQSK